MNFLAFSTFYFQIRDVLKNEEVVKHFAKSERVFKLLLKKWSVLQEMQHVLHVPFITTNMLQKADFALSDFFGCLKIMNLKIEQMMNSSTRKHTNLAEKLKQTLEKRKRKMLDNQLMLCAIYLDPRYKCEVDKDPEKMQLVRFTLESLWERMKLVKNGEPVQLENQEPTADDIDSMEKFFDELDEQYNSLGIRSGGSEDGLNGIDYTQDKSHITKAIDKYNSSIQIRMKSSENIHAFWEKNKEEYGFELYEIASVIFAVPPTQTSVERTFSALKFMLTDKRYNLNQDLLECMLLIHLNRDIYYRVKAKEIEKVARETG